MYIIIIIIFEYYIYMCFGLYLGYWWVKTVDVLERLNQYYVLLQSETLHPGSIYQIHPPLCGSSEDLNPRIIGTTERNTTLSVYPYLYIYIYIHYITLHYIPYHTIPYHTIHIYICVHNVRYIMLDPNSNSRLWNRRVLHEKRSSDWLFIPGKSCQSQSIYSFKNQILQSISKYSITNDSCTVSYGGWASEILRS